MIKEEAPKLVGAKFIYSTINMRGDVLAIILVEIQPPKMAAITLTKLIPILVGQFITSGSSSKP